MGEGGPQLVDSPRFRQAVKIACECLSDLCERTAESLTDEEWERIVRQFQDLEVIGSSPILVGNSKLLAHLLPKLVAPIDRRYSLTFFQKIAQHLRGDPERQVDFFSGAYRNFFHPLATEFAGDARVTNAIAENSPQRKNWDTSAMKVIDNVVIGLSSKKVEPCDLSCR